MAPHQGSQGKVIAETCAWHSTSCSQDPPRKRSVVRAQGPALTHSKVEKRKFRTARPRQPVFRANCAEIATDGLVARQDEVIAIVDHHIEQAVTVGAAAPAGLLRCF